MKTELLVAIIGLVGVIIGFFLQSIADYFYRGRKNRNIIYIIGEEVIENYKYLLLVYPFDLEKPEEKFPFCLRMQKEASDKIKSKTFEAYFNLLYDLKTKEFKLINALYTNYRYLIDTCKRAKLQEDKPDSITQVNNLDCIQRMTEYSWFCILQTKQCLLDMGFSKREIDKVTKDALKYKKNQVKYFEELERIVKKHPITGQNK